MSWYKIGTLSIMENSNSFQVNFSFPYKARLQRAFANLRTLGAQVVSVAAHPNNTNPNFRLFKAWRCAPRRRPGTKESVYADGNVGIGRLKVCKYLSIKITYMIGTDFICNCMYSLRVAI